MDRSWMKVGVCGLATYCNPDVGDALRMDTNVNILGFNLAAEVYLRDLEIDTKAIPIPTPTGLWMCFRMFGIRCVCGS